MKSKSFLSLILAALMLCTMFTGLTVSAANTETASINKIYFEIPDWEGETYYTHIWEVKDSGDAFFNWQMSKEKLTEEDGKLYYDLSVLNESTNIQGGIKSGVEYRIMFSDNLGNETCALPFNTDCIGDTAKVVSNSNDYENSIDSTKHSYEISWTKNANKYGVPLEITSVGTIQGKFINKGVSVDDIITEWDKAYPQYPNKTSYSTQSSARDHKTRLAEIREELYQRVTEGKILVMGGGKYTEEKLTSIKIASLPNKVKYVQGEKFKKSGLKVTACYSNGKKVNVTNYTLSGTSLKVGKNTITVKYQGCTAKFTVTVTAKKVDGIYVTGNYKKTYAIGEKFSKKGLKVVACFNDGTTKTVTGYSLKGYNSKKGTKYIEVKYKGKVAYFKVNVCQKKLTSIKVTSLPNKTTYKKGQKLNTKGLTVVACYNNETSKKVTNYSLKYNFNKTGNQKVTVSYGGKTTSFIVKVKA